MNMNQTLRDIRMEHDMSQEVLAELLNVSRQTISRWENGSARPSGDNLAALSEIFGLPIDALVKGSWTPPPEPDPVVVEVPVEVPVPRPRNYRLLAAVAAVLVVVGIAIGVMLFREPPDDSIPDYELGGEVIDPSTIGEIMPFLPLE